MYQNAGKNGFVKEQRQKQTAVICRLLTVCTW